MNLHEYQAKAILKKYGIPVQEGILATNADEAVAAFEQLGGKFAVIKAQVHAGGRGKAGGVQVVKSKEEAADYTSRIIGTRLVTYQTDANGQPVNSVLVCEDVYPVERELYLGAVLTALLVALPLWHPPKVVLKLKKLQKKHLKKLLKLQ